MERFIYLHGCLVRACKDFVNLCAIVNMYDCNKKVLLRERKRHTARRVASPWLGGGGYLSWPGGYLPWGTLHPDLAGGNYLGQGDTYLGWGVPTLARGVPTLGYPLSWPGGGGVPTSARGIPTATYLAEGTYLGQGLPTLGYPLLTSLGGYLPWLGGNK